MSTQIPITLNPSAAVATNGTMTFTYPSGYNAASFIYGGATLWAEGLETLFTEGASNFSLVYGASTVVVTYLGATSIPAGSRVVLQPSLAPKAGVSILPFFFNLAEIAANGDLLTEYVPGFAFQILGVDFQVCKPVTTAAKRADINLEIGTTNVTGGVVSITSAAATPAGAQIAGSAVTAANVGTATDKLSIEAASVTAHAEGSGWLLVKLLNLDTQTALVANAL